MKLLATSKADQNRAAVDPWTLVHFSAGLALGLMNLSRARSVGLAVGYEVVEQWVERQRWGQELFEVTRPESAPNAVMDVAVFALGHRLGEGWNVSGRGHEGHEGDE